MDRRRFLAGMAGLPAVVASGAAPPPDAPSFPEPGEWPCYRRAGTQDAHSPCKGRITKPSVAWKHFVGGRDAWLAVAPGGPASFVRARLPAEPVVAAESVLGDPRWGLAPPTAEIGGRAQSVEQTTTVAYAHVLPGETGPQKLEFESGFAKPTHNGDWAHDCVGRCFAWRDRAWQQVWQSEAIDGLFAPYPIVGDFDGDGAPEVAVLPWYELLVLDARTGKVKDRCRFTDGRSYGFFGVYDLDGDGRQEFVVQADFAKHVDVLGYRGGKLTLLWRREIETDISNPQKVLRVNPRPAADVDGDGRMEVLVSLWNGTGDGRWRLTVHDGMTGAVKAELADEYLVGVVDVDGDGACELLTVGASGAGVPDIGTIRVYGLKGGTPRSLWAVDHAGWATWEPPLPANVNTAATLGRRDVLWRLVDGRARVAIVGTEAPNARVSLCDWTRSGLQAVAAVSGPGLEAAGMSADGTLLARCSVDGGPVTVRSSGARVTPMGISTRDIPAASVAVVRDGGHRPAILAQGPLGSSDVVAFRPPAAGKPSHTFRRFAGRGQGDNWPYTRYGPVVADLRGDGGRQHVYATAAPSGCARVVAADLRGHELWHHDFPDIPGTPPVWNTGGIILWQAGHFTDRRRMDVLVTVRRSMMHSEETCLLSGRDGRQVWRRAREISSRGVGGTPFAIADFDGDGLDDCASLHPSIFYVLDGATGRDIVAKDCAWPGVPAQPVYWGIPVAILGPGGRAAAFFGTNRRSMTGLVRADGSLAWWDSLDTSPACLPAFGAFTGSGRLEALAAGYPDGIRCYDVTTGSVLWRMPSPAPGDPVEMASADVDSCGRDEALFTCGVTVYCIGAGGGGGPPRGELRWKLDLPATLGPPIVADVDGTGASVLVAGADGFVYCVR